MAKLSKKDWQKAGIYFKQAGAGKVTLKNKTLQQQGSGPKLEILGDKGLKKSGFVVAGKTEVGSFMGGAAPDGFGVGVYPVWKKIIALLLLNPATLNWLLKRIIKSYKFRQK